MYLSYLRLTIFTTQKINTTSSCEAELVTLSKGLRSPYGPARS